MSCPPPDGCKLGSVQGLEFPNSQIFRREGADLLMVWDKMPLQLVPVKSSVSESDTVLEAHSTSAPWCESVVRVNSASASMASSRRILGAHEKAL